MTKDAGSVIIDHKGHVALITLNHPPANTWNMATARDFNRAIDKLESDKNVRAIIITGAGQKCFSAGFDAREADRTTAIGEIVRPLWTRLDCFPKPLIAAINGHALGGGLELALCCHFRLAAEHPELKIGLTELNLGTIPGWGGTQRLSSYVGRRLALEMIIFSKTLTPREALDAGLVDEIVPAGELLEHAWKLAGRLAERPPLAVQGALRAMAAGRYQGLERGLQVEEQAVVSLRDTKDRLEGFTALIEKRTPNFRGE